MLPPQYRLHTEKDISAVLRSRRMVSVSFVLYWRPNRHPVSRFGFLVSKKVSAKATRRNMVKRRLRTAVAKFFPRLTPGYDCLLAARAAALGKTYQELETELAGQLSKIRLFNV